MHKYPSDNDAFSRQINRYKILFTNILRKGN